MPERTTTRPRGATAPQGQQQRQRRPRATAATGARRDFGVSGGSRASFEHAILWLLAVGRRGIVVVLALAVLTVFTAGVFEQRWKEQRLQAQVAAQRVSLQAAEARSAQLQSQLAESDPAAYRAWVEDTARRQLNLGYSGETVFLVKWATPAATPTSATVPTASVPTASAPTTGATAPQRQREAHWRQWLRLIFGD